MLDEALHLPADQLNEQAASIGSIVVNVQKKMRREVEVLSPRGPFQNKRARHALNDETRSVTTQDMDTGELPDVRSEGMDKMLLKDRKISLSTS